MHHNSSRGLIAWMAKNSVTPNLLMIFLIIGGLISSMFIRKEVYPDHQFNSINTYVFYAGATPTEMEQGILLPIENAIAGIEGIKEVVSRANSNSSFVRANLDKSADANEVLREIENAVNRVRLPKGAEKPRITRSQTRRESMELIFYGDVNPIALRETANEVKNLLLRSEYLTQVELDSPAKYRIKVEIDAEMLEKYGLTLEQVSKAISNRAFTKSGGKLEAHSGDILIQVDELQIWADGYRDIVVSETANGSKLMLSDIAKISDGFADKRIVSFYNGQTSSGILIYRTGEQTPVGISEHVYAMMPEIENLLQKGIQMDIVRDDAVSYKQRMDLLLKNAFSGLLLVLVILSIFLDSKVAFWAVVGIPTSFLGTIIFLPSLDVSINMISMFGFIIALGIVVDDAIIVGESIYDRLSKGASYREAAIEGAKEIFVPLTFSIITNIIAFIPIFFLPGTLGMMFGVIPIIVGLVFAISWVEAILILPSHLAHSKSSPQKDTLLTRVKAKIDKSVEYIAQVVYRSVLNALLPYRYFIVVSMTSILIVGIGYATGGHIGFSTMPRIESEFSNARVILPVGMSLQDATDVRLQLENAAYTIIEKNGGDALAKSVNSSLRNIDGEFIINVRIFLTPSEVRDIPTREVSRLWRKATGRIIKADKVRFSSAGGTPTGDVAGITIQLTHTSNDVLENASSELRDILETYQGVVDIENTFEGGVPQLKLTLNDKGEHLGLTERSLLNQVSHAFNGVRSLRIQRSSEEVDVMISLSDNQRQSIDNLERLPIKVGNQYVKLIDVADIEYETSPSVIQRIDGQKRITVNADVTPASEAMILTKVIRDEVFPIMESAYPALTVGFAGDQKAQKESLESLSFNGMLLLLALYCLLATPFNSYSQPLLVMSVIPFGFLGALIGHLAVGINLSVVSLLGVLALSGVVINDSLIMIVEINKRHKETKNLMAAILDGACRRFRPIILTTMTTFFGLSPMIWEPSNQAQLMVPMAVSLGFGIVFATFITLVLLPSLYHILEDIKGLRRNRAHEVNQLT